MGKKKKATPLQKDYQSRAKKLEPKRKVGTNVLRAFLVGGLICTFAQLLQNIFIKYFDFEKSQAGNPATAVLIFISALFKPKG